MSRPSKVTPKVNAAAFSLALTADKAPQRFSSVEAYNRIEDGVTLMLNADVAIDAVIAGAEALNSAGITDWHPERIRQNASMVCRLSYLVKDQLTRATDLAQDLQCDIHAGMPPAPTAVRTAFLAWRDRKVEQLRAGNCSEPVGTHLDKAEIAAFNALAATPAATAEDVLLKVFALAGIECDDGMAHPETSTVFDLRVGDGSGYQSAMWRGLLGDMPSVSATVRDAMSIPMTVPAVRRAA